VLFVVSDIIIIYAETFFEQGGESGIKYKFRFATKFAKYLHQPVISMGVGSYTYSSHLT